MANVDIGDIESLRDSFEEKMGFSADAPGLELNEEQLVNFMLLCQEQMIDDVMGHEDDDMMEGHDMMEDDGMKVKVMKMKGGDVRSMMDQLLGGG